MYDIDDDCGDQYMLSFLDFFYGRSENSYMSEIRGASIDVFIDIIKIICYLQMVGWNR